MELSNLYIVIILTILILAFYFTVKYGVSDPQINSWKRRFKFTGIVAGVVYALTTFLTLPFLLAFGPVFFGIYTFLFYFSTLIFVFGVAFLTSFIPVNKKGVLVLVSIVVSIISIYASNISAEKLMDFNLNRQENARKQDVIDSLLKIGAEIPAPAKEMSMEVVNKVETISWEKIGPGKIFLSIPKNWPTYESFSTISTNDSPVIGSIGHYEFVVLRNKIKFSIFSYEGISNKKEIFENGQDIGISIIQFLNYVKSGTPIGLKWGYLQKDGKKIGVVMADDNAFNSGDLLRSTSATLYVDGDIYTFFFEYTRDIDKQVINDLVNKTLPTILNTVEQRY